MQKGNLFQRILRAVEDKGFYMILGLCVIAVGISAYVLFFTTPQQEGLTGEMLSGKTDLPGLDASGKAPNVTVPPAPSRQEPKEDQETNQPQEPAEPSEPTAKDPEEPPEEEPTEEPPKNDQPVSAPGEAPSNAVQVGSNTTVKQPIFTLPIQSSEVQREYSGDQLVFDPTMSDWRTHGGTDFSCDEGDAVMAVLDGSIAEIYEDAMKGTCIRLDHGAGLESLYCGLTVQDGIKTGQSVTAGQTIGRATGGNLSESAQTCHLHLEMRENGQAIDPMSILK